MLDAMDEVSKFTPDQVAKLSESSRDNYNEIRNNAYKAASFKAQVLEDMLGEDGILARTTAYVQRKVTEPTTYVGRGVEEDKHVKLRKDLEYNTDRIHHPVSEEHLQHQRSIGLEMDRRFRHTAHERQRSRLQGS